MDIRLNQRIMHRAWKWTGTIIDFPFDYTHLSSVTISRDDTGKKEEAWIPSIMPIKEEEEFDWSEDDTEKG